ncbi:MAG: hypothetical protein KDB37_11170 [Ilumatobacter sp.]|nr:hypothetical protein [Ilumatobacter sp.]
MPKRKIEAEVAVNVTGTEDVEKLEKRIDSLQDAEVEIDVDASDAESKLERFERELDELDLDKSRELRIEMRSELLQQEIRGALRQLERLEDPIEIRTQMTRLEEAQRDLQALADLAERKYEVQVEVDPRRNARRAADDVDLMRQRAEGLQRGIGPLRGFTDELGATAGAGGIAASAMIDAGEAVEIFGAQLGLSESALSRWSLALGGIGIAAGIAIPLIASLADSQNDVAEATDAANDRIREQTGLLDQLNERLAEQPSIVEALLPEDDRDQILKAFSDLGFSLDDIDRALIAANANGREFAAQRIEMAGASREEADRLAEVLVEHQKYDQVLLNAKGAANFAFENEELVSALGRVLKAARDIDESNALDLFTSQVELAGTAEQIDAVTAALERLADAPVAEQLAAALDAFEENAPAAEEAVNRVTQTVIEGSGAWGDWGGAARDALGEVLRGATDAVAALDPVAAALFQITGQIDAEQQMIAIADQFDRVRVAAAEAMQAAADGSADAEKKARDYRREQLRLTEQVLDYVSAVEDIPLSTVTNIRAALDEGDLLEAQQLLEEISGDKFATVYVDVLPRNTRAFDSISFRVDDGKLVQQTPNYGAGTFTSAPIIHIVNPPGTPAATMNNVELFNKRNGDRSAAL